MFTNGEIITSTRLVDKNDCNVANGYCGLNGSGLISFSKMPMFYYIRWNADYQTMSAFKGTWNQVYDLNNTVGSNDLTGINGGYVSNASSHIDLDEIEWINLKLTSGKYTVAINYVSDTNTGIIEALHGTTVLGTQDSWNYSGALYNQMTYFYISCTNRTENFRLRVNSKNSSSLISNFIINIGSIRIVKDG